MEDMSKKQMEDLRERHLQVFALLPDDERQVLTMRSGFFHEMPDHCYTLEECAENLGVTREQAHIIESDAVEKLYETHTHVAMEYVRLALRRKLEVQNHTIAP